MVDSDELEHELLSRPLPDPFQPEEDWVVPAYDGRCIANVPATVAALFGLSLRAALPPLHPHDLSSLAPGLQRVVLITVDGLGYRLLRERWRAGDGAVLSRLAQNGCLVPLTSVFPSTTDAALVSLSTGCAPATHGWLAWEFYLREWGVAANGVLLCPVLSRQRDILLDWGLEPEALVPVPALASRLARAGISTIAVLSRHFERSGFTRLVYRGFQQVRGHYHASDLWTQLRGALHDTRGERAFLSAYWGGLDTVGHAYGPDTEPWHTEFRSFCHLLEREFLARLPSEDRSGTLLLVTADHGQLRVPEEHTVTADQEPALRRLLQVPVLGESRAAFVHPLPGRAEAVRDYLDSAFPGCFQVLRSSDALSAGIMGQPVFDETFSRAGELLVLGRADYALQRSRPAGPLVGRHGGLSARELVVPLIAARLESLP